MLWASLLRRRRQSDRLQGAWFQGKLIDKVGAGFTSTASQHGGQETTLTGIHTNLLHHGRVIAGLLYSFQGQLGLEEVTDRSRQPSANELEGARFLGRHVAEIAARLAA